MLLYEAIKKSLTALRLLDEPLPMAATITHDILWMGEVAGDLFEIEIRKSKEELGWLYSKATILLFSHEQVTYECNMNNLRVYVEDLFKEKVTVHEPSQLVHGKLYRDINQKWIGGIDTGDMIAISKPINL